MLTEQKTDIKGFADFMQKLSAVKEHVPSLKEKVEYIKNLYEVRIWSSFMLKHARLLGTEEGPFRTQYKTYLKYVSPIKTYDELNLEFSSILLLL